MKIDFLQIGGRFITIALPMMFVLNLTAIPISMAETSGTASHTSETHNYNIAAQPLGEAMIEFGKQSGLQISTDTAMLANKRTAGVQGVLSIHQALDILLANTGLTYRINGTMLTLIEIDSNATKLPTVQVSATGIKSDYTTDQLNTGTGLGLSAQETPQSVSVITQQRIEDQDMRSLTDVVINATGVSAKEFDSSRHGFAARGFDIDNYQIDGVPITWDAGWSAGETQTDTSLYERVEVVRGATGLLTGAGNPSASINLVRKHADSKEFTGSVSLGVSRWNTYNATTDLSTPLNHDGSVRGRIVASYEDGESYVDFAEEKKQVFYAVLDADLTERTLLSIGASYQDNDPTASRWGGLPTWFSDGTRTDWDRSKTTAAKWSSWASTNKSYFVNLSHKFAQDWEIKLSANHFENVGDLHLLFLFGQLDRTTGLGLNPFPARYDSTREQNNIDLQLTGYFNWLGREHELILGASNSKQEHVTYSYASTGVASVGNFYNWDGSYPEPIWGARTKGIDVTTEQKGFYAATRLSLTEKLKVILGGRITDWEEVGTSNGTAVNYGDNVFTPYAGGLYDLNDMHTVYASYTEIFQPQNNQDRNGAFLDPITGKSYELGLKSAYLSGKLNTTATIFRIEQDNLAQLDPDGVFVPGTTSAAYVAAKGAVSEGYEFEVIGNITPRWDISFSFTKFEAEDASGQDVNTDHPRKLLKLFTTYNLPGDWNKLTVGGGVNWEGNNYVDTTNPVTSQPERLEQKAYSLVNLMARYDIDEQLSAQLNIDNLFDEKYFSQIGFFNQYAYGEPRNISLKVKYQF